MYGIIGSWTKPKSRQLDQVKPFPKDHEHPPKSKKNILQTDEKTPDRNASQPVEAPLMVPALACGGAHMGASWLSGGTSKGACSGQGGNLRLQFREVQ